MDYDGIIAKISVFSFGHFVWNYEIRNSVEKMKYKKKFWSLLFCY
jgi:hypothetical protein